LLGDHTGHHEEAEEGPHRHLGTEDRRHVVRLRELMPAITDYAVVLLTQGLRPVELDRAVRSVMAQQGVTTDIVVVGNGWEPTGLSDGVRAVGRPESVCIPAGRNAGLAATTAPMIFFLDDDAWLPEPDSLLRISRMFADNPRFGLIQPRVT